MRPFLVGVDFDGTIAEHQFPDIGPPVPGAFEWLHRFRAAGARLILWTMRSDGRSGEGKENGPVLLQAMEFCLDRGITFWGINDNPEQRSWTQSPKVYCHTYIDDANAGCPLIYPYGRRPYVDWEKVGPLVLGQIEAYNARTP